MITATQGTEGSSSQAQRKGVNSFRLASMQPLLGSVQCKGQRHLPTWTVAWGGLGVTAGVELKMLRLLGALHPPRSQNQGLRFHIVQGQVSFHFRQRRPGSFVLVV
jgi:hypothetical protein